MHRLAIALVVTSTIAWICVEAVRRNILFAKNRLGDAQHDSSRYITAINTILLATNDGIIASRLAFVIATLWLLYVSFCRWWRQTYHTNDPAYETF
jgi:hypothetical protein